MILIKLSAIGVTPQKEAQFRDKGIYSAEDLLRFLPRKYKDFTRETGILPEEQVSCITVRFERLTSGTKTVPRVTAVCTDEKTGKTILVTWFNQPYMRRKLAPYLGRNVYLAGKMHYDAHYNNYTVVTPELFEPNTAAAKRVYPVYSKIKGMSTEYLVDKIMFAIDTAGATAETLPFGMPKTLGLLPLRDALYQLHFPKSMNQVNEAQKRILFDDLLYFALENEWSERNAAIGSPFALKSLRLMKTMADSLPYTLTPDQHDAVDEMVKHVRSGRRLCSLVQGDVGCGKTIVAFLMMAGFAESGYQTAMMAPTQVLAKQHYEGLRELVEPLGYTVEYLGSEIKRAERKCILERIASGEAKFIVGTSSILGKDVTYKNLALTVVDEEHKFGVAQRAAITEKAAAGVHSITMSATPIPRSLAQVVYGDSMQLHGIHTMPNGRKPIITGIAKSRERVYRFLRALKRNGAQAYVVCPMIDQNDDMEGVKSVEEISAEYRAALTEDGIRIETLTGRNTSEETEAIISAFKAGQIDVLISTTVIEVGINVPNASAIIITNAERFGLSSLHQLRGRVGRSSAQAYCVLETEDQTVDGAQRIRALCETTDGFKIAEADLKIRGAGDFLGTRQSGDNKYISLMLAYPDTYNRARVVAKDLLDAKDRCIIVSRVVDGVSGEEFTIED